MNVTARHAAALMAGIGAIGAIAWACAGGPESPTLVLAKTEYDPYGSGAMLVPGNDTRTNLLLLLADRRGTSVRDPATKREGPPLVQAGWKLLAEDARPPAKDSEESYENWDSTRCQTSGDGAAEYEAALAKANLPAAERAALSQARKALSPQCKDGDAAATAPAVASPIGRAFAAYLEGASAFYAGRFDVADARFRGLSGAPDPWVREAAIYMVGRTALNKSIATSVNEYGWLEDAAKRDKVSAAAAGQGFAAYLKAYPQGRYASSARGLMRRVAWLSGDDRALAAAYDRQFQQKEYDGAWDDLTLIEEIDSKLLESSPSVASRDPVLTAVDDLRRMRKPTGYDLATEPRPISQQELEAQRPIFANDKALFDYLRAAHALFVRNQPSEVMGLIPDAAHQPRFSYLEFSRQMLRGVALDAVGDRNARGFWLSLFPGAVQPYQRSEVELGLALHDERSGTLAKLFEPGSPVTHPILRQILVEKVASPALLREVARGGISAQERYAATYTLLTKELRGGQYKAWLGDVALIPADPPEGNGYWSALYFSPTYSEHLDPPPLSVFGKAAKLGDFGCPALSATVSALAGQPGAPRPSLCLAEFFRNNGFDGYEEDMAPTDGSLGSSRTQFPFTPYDRQGAYLAVLGSPAASADDKALALNRLVRCYAPSGYSSCGAKQVEQPQRKAWFDRLNRDYPASRWAKDLRYYW